VLTTDPGFGPWQPPTARTAALATRFRNGTHIRAAYCGVPGAAHHAVTDLRHGPVIQICSWCGAWRDTGEYLGRGVVRFGGAETARRFVEALGPLARAETCINPQGALVVLESLGSDEQIGMRLHIAAAEWLLAEGEPVVVDRVHVAPPGAVSLKVVVKEAG
jgi:hypothetical protein